MQVVAWLAEDKKGRAVLQEHLGIQEGLRVAGACVPKFRTLAEDNLEMILRGSTPVSRLQEEDARRREAGQPVKSCDACGASGEAPGVKLMLCMRCRDTPGARAAFYCSRECQKRAWPEHKKVRVGV